MKSIWTAADEVFRELEQKMFTAHEGLPDLETIDQLYASDFISTNADGRVVDKNGWLETLKNRRFLVDKITSADFKVRRYLGAAVVTGRSSYFKGGQKLADIRHTQVWAEYENRWQLVSWQGTPISEETSKQTC